VTFTQTTVDHEIDRLWLRVTLRAAELGLTITQVAKRMGVHRTRLLKACEQPAVTRAWFWRLSVALEMGPPETAHLSAIWSRPVPEAPNVSAEKMRRALRRKMR
jgi:hypothetical protein